MKGTNENTVIKQLKLLLNLQFDTSSITEDHTFEHFTYAFYCVSAGHNETTHRDQVFSQEKITPHCSPSIQANNSRKKGIKHSGSILLKGKYITCA